MVAFNVTMQLGGTALLIVVVVSMDFMSQVQAAHDVQPVREADGKIEPALLWSRIRAAAGGLARAETVSDLGAGGRRGYGENGK